MRSSSFILLIICSVCAFGGANSCYAQSSKRSKDSLYREDILDIGKKAANTINRFSEELNDLYYSFDADLDLGEYVKKRFLPMFASEESTVYLDWDTEKRTNDQVDNKRKPMEYLLSFRDNFDKLNFAHAKNSKVQFRIVGTSSVRQKSSKFMFVIYDQDFPVPGTRRIAEMKVINDGNSWKTTILSVNFYDARFEQIVKDTTDDIPTHKNKKRQISPKSDLYYEMQLAYGKYAMKDGDKADLTKAWVCLHEARANDKTQNEAERQKNFLQSDPRYNAETIFQNALNTANNLFNARKYTEAYKWYQGALEFRPNDQVVASSMRRAKIRLEQFEKMDNISDDPQKVVEAYETEKRNDSSNVEVWIGLAKWYAKTNDPAADSAFFKASSKDPENIELLVLAGQYYEANRRYADAMKIYDRCAKKIKLLEWQAMDVQLESRKAFCSGMIAYNNHEFQAACTNFEKVLAASRAGSANVVAFSYWALARYELPGLDDKQRDSIVKAVRQSIISFRDTLSPGYEISRARAQLHYCYGHLLYKHAQDGNYNMVIQQYEKSVEYYDRDPIVNMELAMICQMKARYKDPNKRGFIAAAINDYKRALDLYEKVIQANGNTVEAYRRKAQCYCNLGKLTKDQSYFDAAEKDYTYIHDRVPGIKNKLLMKETGDLYLCKANGETDRRKKMIMYMKALYYLDTAYFNGHPSPEQLEHRDDPEICLYKSIIYYNISLEKGREYGKIAGKFLKLAFSNGVSRDLVENQIGMEGVREEKAYKTAKNLYGY